MDRNLIQCDREFRHMATADYWPDILKKLDNDEAENARRITWQGLGTSTEERANRRRNAKRQIYCLSPFGLLS